MGTASYRQELSDAAFSQWDNVESRKKILGAREGMWTPELRQQVSETMQQVASGEAWLRENAKTTAAAWKRGAFDGVYKSPSGLEKKVAEALDACGILYVPQHRLEGDSRPFDFFVPAAILLIEVDGEYWHGLPGRAERDARKDELAKERGFELLRIKETDIHKQGAEVIVKERVLPVCTCICGGDYASSSR